MSETELSPVKRALIEQRRLKARIEELERARREPIAVIGVGCRFPGASGPAAFWELLHTGVDAISDMPAARWNVDERYDPDPEAPGKFATRFGGYLDAIDAFDAHRFGISPREATTMDPQQRVLLEVTWEALEHAGLATDAVAGAPMGVFVGIGPTDYSQQYALRGDPNEIDAYLATGNAHSVASGRISYLLGLHGPSISIDTACSSSLVAVHLACESIRSGSCDSAIAGGVGILLGEQNYISLSKARMMAPDGRCKAFDASANGFVRSEGCGVVVLKRLTDAQRDGDRVLAVIRGTAVNQDGRSNGITAPNGPAQQAVIRAAHANAGTSPAAVGYVEAHGTGTVLGDPIEVESLTAVLGEGRQASQPLLLGSVKSNIGHTEAAAGIAGLIKTVLALTHREVPPSLHFRTPNPHIAWEQYPYLRVPTLPTPWTASETPRVAGVSAFGFSGTNAHVVLEEAPRDDRQRPAIDRPVHVLALSAKTDRALHVSAAELASHVARSSDTLGDLCFSANTSRAALPHRAFIVATSRDALRGDLEALASGRSAASLRASVVSGGTPRVMFFCPDGESISASAVRRLYDTQPSFRAAVDECDALFAGWQQAGVFDAIGHASDHNQRTAARVAIEYALASMWAAWGVKPDAVLGRGAGDYASAVVAGALTLDDTLSLASGRGARDAVSIAAAEIPLYSSQTGRRVTHAELGDLGRWAGSTAAQSQTDAARAAAASEGFLTTVDLSVVDWDALAASLGDLFLRGVSIDWRGFDRGYARTLVDLPASPWIRERYWFDDKIAAPESKPAVASKSDAPNAWTAADRAAARQATMVPLDVELSRFRDLWSELEAVTTRAITRAIRELGLFASAGEQLTVDEAMAKSGALPVYHHLLALWFQRLTRAGVLVRNGERYAAANGAVAVSGARTFGRASEAFPLLRDYLARCEEQMTAIVTGRRSPLDTLFPNGSFETADFFYREWGLARYYNAILAAASQAMIQRGGRQPLRVLEIGAGTGGTAATLLPLLANAGAEYWFTDVSEHFFGRAEEAFAGAAGVRYQRFDLDEAPGAQGIPVGQFDIVVAANSVHATKNLGRALEHVKSLLAPGGVVMLYEVTTHLDWFEMSIALIEGWQHHIDELRSETPLLSPAQWEHVLRDRGFDRVAFYPPAGSPAEILGHHIIVASAPVAAAALEPALAVAPPASAAHAPATTQPSTPRAAAPIAAPLATPAARDASSTPSDAAALPLRERLAALTHGERKEIVQQLVQKQVMRVMRLRAGAPAPASDDRLMSIGVDSLMAVELRKLLSKELDGALELPSTLIFDYPTIGAIATLILGSLGFSEDAEPVAERAAPAAGANAAAAALSGLSDTDVEAMLLAQLKGLSE